MPNYKSCIVLLTVHFFILVNVYSQSKPLKVYEKDGITLKSYKYFYSNMILKNTFKL